MKVYEDLDNYNYKEEVYNNKLMEIISNLKIPNFFDVTLEELNNIIKKAYLMDINNYTNTGNNKAYYVPYEYLLVIENLAYKLGYIRGYDQGVTFGDKPVQDETMLSPIDLYKSLVEVRKINNRIGD